MQGLLNKLSKILFHNSLSGYLEPIMQAVMPAWRSGQSRAQIQNIALLREDVVRVVLKPESGWNCHDAGQHISLTIEMNGRLISRVFTIASSPNYYLDSNLIELVIRTHEDGMFTPLLSKLALGQWVNISKPMGNFTLNSQVEHTTMLAGGSGITPFIAMLNEQNPQSSQAIHLIYYAQSHSHLLIGELTSLLTKLPNFSFELLNRTEHGSFEKYINPKHTDELLVCGPEEMYLSAKKFAEHKKIKFRAEHFRAMQIKKSTDKESTFVARLNEEVINVSAQRSLLSEFQAQGKPVQFGCGMGICHQCLCKKKYGIVKDIRNGAISDNGEELIQLCVTHPLTDLELEI